MSEAVEELHKHLKTPPVFLYKEWSVVDDFMCFEVERSSMRDALCRVIAVQLGIWKKRPMSAMQPVLKARLLDHLRKSLASGAEQVLIPAP